MFERLTPAARSAVVEAQAQARALGHDEVGAEHLLLGVVTCTDGLGARVLRELGLQREALVRDLAVLGTADADALRSIGVDLEAVRRNVEARFGPGALDRPRWRTRLFRERHLRLVASARKALEQSLRHARALGHDSIGSGHVLLGLLADDQDPAARALQRLGVPPDAVRTRLREELGRAAA